MERESKLYRLGHSWAVTIPPDWIRSNRLDDAPRVAIEYDDDSVTIRPVNGKGRKK